LSIRAVEHWVEADFDVGGFNVNAKQRSQKKNLIVAVVSIIYAFLDLVILTTGMVKATELQ